MNIHDIATGKGMDAFVDDIAAYGCTAVTVDTEELNPETHHSLRTSMDALHNLPESSMKPFYHSNVYAETGLVDTGYYQAGSERVTGTDDCGDPMAFYQFRNEVGLPNLLPAGYCKPIENWKAGVEALSKQLLAAIIQRHQSSFARDISADMLSSRSSMLRMIDYRPQPGDGHKVGQERIHAHTDKSVLTLLPMGDQSGLQAGINDKWVDAPWEKDQSRLVIFINAGDSLTLLTGGTFNRDTYKFESAGAIPAGNHRVVYTEESCGKIRRTAPLFSHLPFDYELIPGMTVWEALICSYASKKGHVPLKPHQIELPPQRVAA